MRACMHACTQLQQSDDRASASVRLSDSFVNLGSCVEDGFSSSLEIGYIVVGLFFPFPNSILTWQVRLPCLTAADPYRRCHSPLPQERLSSNLFAKHVTFERSVSSPRPLVTWRRKNTSTMQKFCSTQSTVIVSLLHSAWSARTSRLALSKFLSIRKYRYRSYTQTDDTHCCPWTFKVRPWPARRRRSSNFGFGFSQHID